MQVVVGCGPTGSALAARLDSESDQVAVVDLDGASRHRLPAAFRGTFLEGDGVNRAVLEAAGIQHAEVLIAVSSSDSTNVVVARVARDVFRVPHVVGRIDDPDSVRFGTDLGLTMIASVRTLESGDVVSFMVAAGSLGRLRSFLGGRWPQ